MEGNILMILLGAYYWVWFGYLFVACITGSWRLGSGWWCIFDDIIIAEPSCAVPSEWPALNKLYPGEKYLEFDV